MPDKTTLSGTSVPGLVRLTLVDALGDAELNPAPTLARLLWTATVIGCTSFGGGLNAYVRLVFVGQKRWISENDFIESLELAQVLPGPNVVNLTVALGNRLAGAPGACVALIGLIVPGIAANIVLAIFILSISLSGPLGGALAGVSAAAVGLSISNTWTLGRAHITTVSAAVIATAALVAAGMLDVPLVVVVVVLGLVGMLAAYRRERRTDAELPADGSRP